MRNRQSKFHLYKPSLVCCTILLQQLESVFIFNYMDGTGKLLPVHYSSIPPSRSFIHPFYTVTLLLFPLLCLLLLLEHSCICLLTNLYHTCLYYQNHVMVAGSGIEPMALNTLWRIIFTRF